MLKPFYSNNFQKELLLAQKRGLDISLLKETVKLLLTGEPLPAKYRNHKLKGSLSNYWECHITPDWILTYKINKKDGVITFARTGTHSDLF
jgi:mRNA interferase YafQ